MAFCNYSVALVKRNHFGVFDFMIGYIVEQRRGLSQLEVAALVDPPNQKWIVTGWTNNPD